MTSFIDDDGNELQFNGDFAITKQAGSFVNGSVKGDVSVTFSVDNNSHNRKVLGYSGPQMVTQVAWTKQAFNRLENGNLIDRGFIVIQSDDTNTLRCFYTSGNSNWLQLLTPLITELDFSDYETQITSTNIYNSISSDRGIIFPMVDWCYNLNKGSNEWFASGLRDVSQDQFNTFMEFYPCFYLHSLVDTIERQRGIKIGGNILDDPIYKRIVIAPVGGAMRRKDINVTTAVGTDQTTTSTSFVQYTSYSETSDPEGLFDNDVYTANKASKLRITLNIIDTSVTGISAVEIEVIKNSTQVFLYSQAPDVALGPYTFETSVVSGDVIMTRFRRAAAVGGGSTTVKCNIKIDIPTVITINDYVRPNYFLPELTCIDIIKFVINFFGAVAYFNDFNKKLSINIVDKINLEDAQDWSEYYLSHDVNYSIDSAANNFLRLQDADETMLRAYNKGRTLKYGEGNITTNNTLKDKKDLFKIPFSASEFGVAKNENWVTNIPLISLIDSGEPIQYTSIVDDGSGNARFVFSAATTLVQGQVCRIVDTSQDDIGYFVVRNQPSSDSVTFYGLLYTTTSTGRINLVSKEFIDINPRFLIVGTNRALTDISSVDTTYNIYDSAFSATSRTGIANAHYSKSKTGKNIDLDRSNLAFENPENETFQDPTIKELYFNKISGFIGRPQLTVSFILPEAVFKSFKFDRFIYINTEKLTGYFFVDSIEGYQDARTPVDVNLYML